MYKIQLTTLKFDKSKRFNNVAIIILLRGMSCTCNYTAREYFVYLLSLNPGRVSFFQ